jgi:hypothetical protein
MARPLHVVEHLVDGLLLVGRLVEGEGGLELAEHAVGLGEGVAGQGLPLRVQLQQLLGHLLDLGRDLAAGLLPGDAAQAIELGLGAVGAGVARDLVEPVDGQVERAAFVLEVQEVDGRAAQRQLGEALVEADAVDRVDDEVARLEIREVGALGAEGARDGALGRVGGAAVRARAEDFLLGDHAQGVLAGVEALGERADDERGRARRRQLPQIGGGGGAGGRDVVAGEQAAQAVGGGDAAADQRDPLALVVGLAQRGDQRTQELLGLLGARACQRRGQLGVGHGREAHHGHRVVAAVQLERARLHDRGRTRQHGRVFVLAEVVVVGGQRDAVVGAAGLEAFARVVELGGDRAPHAVGIDDEPVGVLGQVVGERRHARVEGGRERLDAEEVLACLQLLEQHARLGRRVVRGVGGGEHARPELGAGGAHGLAHGMEVELVQIAQRALRARVVEADRLDQVAEQIDAHGQPVERGKDVHDPAAHGERAGILDDRRAPVARALQEADELLPVQLLLRNDEVAELGQLGAGDHAAQQGGRAGHDDVPGEPLAEPEQGGQPAHDRRPVGRELGVRAGFDSGQVQHPRRGRRVVARRARASGQEKRGIPNNGEGLRLVRDHDHERTLLLLQRARNLGHRGREHRPLQANRGHPPRSTPDPLRKLNQATSHGGTVFTNSLSAPWVAPKVNL